MNNKIIEAIETIEEKIERIKWMIPISFSLKRAGISDTLNLIRKSAGVLSKDSLKGTVFEKRMRKEWETNTLGRMG